MVTTELLKVLILFKHKPTGHDIDFTYIIFNTHLFYDDARFLVCLFFVFF